MQPYLHCSLGLQPDLIYATKSSLVRGSVEDCARIPIRVLDCLLAELDGNPKSVSLNAWHLFKLAKRTIASC